MGDPRGWLEGELLHETGEEQEKLHFSQWLTSVHVANRRDGHSGGLKDIWAQKSETQSGQRQKLAACDFSYLECVN